MLDTIVAALRCPVCRGTLDDHGGALRCAGGHSFDVARQGYVNLLTGRSPHTGDTAEMIADRAAFLAAGHYDFVARALADAVTDADADGLVLDAGTGTGHYLAAVLDAAPAATGLGLDVSKPALRRAARAHPRAGAACADLWAPLPVADGAAAVVLDVFAPRNAAEFRRVLRPGGVLLVVTPAADHLGELVAAHGLLTVEKDKPGRVRDSLGGRFTEAGRTTLRRTLTLSGAEVRTLIGMTPSARTFAGETAPATVTAAVDLTVWA
ncbi:putative RNA methyltransferase [Spirilliplanes yamanashiensis]|uniref:Ubiquinone biosynthesis protein n=1 Tax=Spirilliplanes yamanashiensis TaxID=42233 RepID=A0A8J3Y3N5_9ACTN|nr:methyltransferase domain-containing protein [Spirilliplanes yamanashiensis]MDP9814183.1 23S rRNA (guanine745-N1)-methyltransferase [Spirilliplanes yamanashiensis]GIJ00835.1 ubiquinone biosynthesis protein [Spirilliplanes yamanashiensis]